MLYIWGLPQPPQLDKLLEQLANLRKALYLQLQVYYENYKREQADEEVHRVRSRRALTAHILSEGKETNPRNAV